MTAGIGRAAIETPFDTPPEAGRAIEVAPGVLWLRVSLPMPLDHVNIFALDDGDSWTLIDAGIGTDQGRAEMAELLSGPLSGKPVTRVVLTHHHPDHMGLAGWFKAEHGAELLATRTAWLMARMLILDEQDRPSAESAAFWRQAGMPAKMLAKRLDDRPFNFADVVAPLPLGFTRLQEGTRLRIGGRDWEVRIGHGHAADHASLWSRDDALILGGDQFLATISPNIGVYATEPLADPLGEWLDSCHRFLGEADDTRFVLPGHKLPFTGLPRRLEQLIAHHGAALDRLRTHLATPKTACDCFVPLFGREIRGQAFGHAMVEAVAHINHLDQRGELTRTWRDDGAALWRIK